MKDHSDDDAVMVPDPRGPWEDPIWALDRDPPKANSIIQALLEDPEKLWFWKVYLRALSRFAPAQKAQRTGTTLSAGARQDIVRLGVAGAVKNGLQVDELRQLLREPETLDEIHAAMRSTAPGLVVRPRCEVLLVDDDADNLKTEEGSLTDEYDVVAADPHDACASSRDLWLRHKECRLAVVDLHMPGPDGKAGTNVGIELIKWLKGERPLADVIVWSAYVDVDENRTKAQRAGATRVFGKGEDGFWEAVGELASRR